MQTEQTRVLVRRYYDAFNAQDTEGMLACLHDEFVHDVSQGDTRKGKEKFAEFLANMNECYHEKLNDIVVMVDETGDRAAAEFLLDGKYLKTDEGLPPATGQAYHLRVGAFFEIRDGLVARVSTHYNLGDWTRQVVGEG